MVILIKNKAGSTLYTVTSDTLYGVNLSGVNLTGADLRNVAMPYANFTNANLSGADLDGANVGNATFVEANLINSNWTNTNIKGANFTNAYFISNAYKLVKTENSGLNQAALDKKIKYFDNWIEIPV